MGEIAAEFPGLGSPFALPIDGALYFAMAAKARRFQRVAGLVKASSLVHLPKRDQQAALDEITLLQSGPGRRVRWEDTLTPTEKEGVKTIEREVAETIEKMRQRAEAAGQQFEFTGRVDDELAARFKKIVGKGQEAVHQAKGGK